MTGGRAGRRDQHPGARAAPGFSLLGSVVALVALLLNAAGADVGAQVAILALVAFALGVQNSVVRHLAVPDLTTTVLTMTLTGIGADLRRRDVATAVRRLVTVLSMLVGAFVGAVLVTGSGVGTGLVAVVGATAGALVATAVVSRGEHAWAVPRT